MCYVLYLATDCPEDLAARSSQLVRFERAGDEGLPSIGILTQPHRWFVGSKSGCSCTFRHLYRDSVDLGFGAPEDWYPEEQDALDATRELYEIVKGIVERGHEVELLDCWHGDEDKVAVTLDVSLGEVSAGQFRLFEGYLFRLRP